MELSVITPQRKVVEGVKITELFAPGIEGQLDILPNHANLVTELETGVLRWKTSDGRSNAAAVSYGWLEVNGSRITVLADVAEMGSDISVERAKAAEGKARKAIESGGLDDSDFRKQELKLQRAMARQASIS
ncbi:MAG TPA: ATP synthase F1 subunit epsilon [Bdellovibrionota bacterium]|jgi:F-type H+-transporting ATPase subunit epsilon|nr:ATP synthase F1 subunit epsilon [Bdellovibrionota bacterium]